MERKIDKIAADISEMRIDVAEIRKDINYHIKRTDLLESAVEPLKEHIANVNFLFRAIAWVAGLSGLIGLIVKFYG